MTGRLVARVEGQVQGVGFRYATVRQATALGGITGFVRNLGDGSVEVVAEGETAKLEQLVLWLKRGPSGSRVRSVETRHEPATGQWAGFGVEY